MIKIKTVWNKKNIAKCFGVTILLGTAWGVLGLLLQFSPEVAMFGGVGIGLASMLFSMDRWECYTFESGIV